MGKHGFKSVFEELNNYDGGGRQEQGNRRGNQQRQDTRDEFDPNRITDLRRELDRQEQYLAATCRHQNRDGSLDVQVLSDEQTVRCNACKSQFNFGIITPHDLQKAVFTVDSAIQQMRVLSNNSKRDIERAQYLGETAYEVRQVPKLYGRLVDSQSRDGRRRKKGKRRDDFAAYRSATEMFNIR